MGSSLIATTTTTLMTTMVEVAVLQAICVCQLQRPLSILNMVLRSGRLQFMSLSIVLAINRQYTLEASLGKAVPFFVT